MKLFGVCGNKMDVDVPVLAGTLIVPQSLFSSFKSKKVNIERYSLYLASQPIPPIHKASSLRSFLFLLF